MIEYDGAILGDIPYEVSGQILSCYNISLLLYRFMQNILPLTSALIADELISQSEMDTSTLEASAPGMDMFWNELVTAIALCW